MPVPLQDSQLPCPVLKEKRRGRSPACGRPPSARTGSDVVQKAHVGGRGGTGSFADGTLVHAVHHTDGVKAGGGFPQLLLLTGQFVPQRLARRQTDGPSHQGGLSRSETPVSTVRRPLGIATSTLFRLCRQQPSTRSHAVSSLRAGIPAALAAVRMVRLVVQGQPGDGIRHFRQFLKVPGP